MNIMGEQKQEGRGQEALEAEVERSSSAPESMEETATDACSYFQLYR